MVTVLEAIAATRGIATTATTTIQMKMDSRDVTTGAITIEAAVTAAEADHPIDLVEAKSVEKAPEHLHDLYHARGA